MTGGETAVLVGGGALAAYALSGSGGGLPGGLGGPVPAGTTVQVNVSGFGPFLVFSTDSTPFASQFEAAIQAAGAGYQVISWNVTENTLTSALLNNQVPYSGTITIVTTTAFGQGSDLVASIAGYLYQVTGYTPIINALGGSAGTPSTTLNLSGLAGLLNNLSSSATGLVMVALVGILAIVWLNQKEIVRRVA